MPGVQRERRARSRVPVLARLREKYELLLTKPSFYRPKATPFLMPDHYVQGKIRQRTIQVLKMTGLVLLALINAGSLGMIVSYVSSVQQGSCVILTEKVTQVELSNYDSITNTNASYTGYTFLFSFRLHTRDGQVYSVSQDDTGLRMQASESYGYTSFEEAERALANFHVGQRYPCS